MDENNIGKAFLHILYQIVYVLFIVPYHIWCKALQRLAAQRENKALKFSEINSPWPMLTFLKRWFIDFLFDMLIAIIWIVGIYLFFKLKIYKSFDYKFSEGLKYTLLYFYGTYFSVVAISWLRDLFILALKPLKKFFSWLSKPAQHLDITIDGEIGFRKQPTPPPAPIAEPVVESETDEEDVVVVDEETPSNFKLKPVYLLGAAAVALLAILAIVLLGKKGDSSDQVYTPVTEEISASAPVEEPVIEEPSMPDIYEFPSYEGYSIGEEMANLVTPDGFAGTMDGMTLQQQFNGWRTTSGGGLKQAKAEDNGYNYQFFFNPDGQLSGIALSHYADSPWSECQTIDERLGTSDSNRMTTLPNGSQVSPGYTGNKVYIFYFYPCAPDPNPAPRR